MIWKAREQFSDDLIAGLLHERGISADLAQEFLDPRYERAHDPFLLTDMDKAAARVREAINLREKITVYADYDADAVTAAAVLLRFFQHLQYQNVDYYIPDRFTEGYGMNPEAVNILAGRGTKLIITVDCGINAVSSVRQAGALGIDVIITDHHQLTEELPRAAAVVNPHRPDDAYPFKDLTGVGVAFKLAQALVISLSSSPDEGRKPEGQEGLNNNPSPTLPSTGERGKRKITKGFEKWLLDLVAIGTVADCQSLLGENRIFVKWGIHVLQKTRWPGLRELLKVAGIADTPLDTYKIGFIIAPRLNAAGRIEHANLALDLLLADDLAQARILAEKLNDLNRRRQELTEQILSEAREQVLASPDKKVLLAAGEWPKGIVGLVAGKLTEEFARPALVLGREREEATGSARSIANFNIVQALRQSSEILVKYGGHPMAAGFTLRSEHIELFHRNLLQYADSVLTEDDLSPVLYYDAGISLSQVTAELVDTLEKFAPFGQGNPRPRFRINNLAVKKARAIGNDGKHLRLHVGISCIGFNLGFWAEKLNANTPVDIICEPQWNDWNGERKIQLKIIDLQFSSDPSFPPLEGEG